LATIAAATFTGLCWGIGGLLLFPETHARQILMILIVGLMASGNSITHAALPAVSQAFILTSLTPIIAYLVYLGGDVYRMTASVMLLFMLSLTALAVRNQKSIVNTICATLASDALVTHFRSISDETSKLNAALEKENIERLRVEDELRRSEHELETILRNLPDTYYRTDAEGRLLRLSSSVQEMLGYDFKEVIGNKLADFYYNPEDRDNFLATLQANQGRVQNYEAALKHRDGHPVWVSTSAQFYYDDEGNIAGVEGVTRDISEKRLYEQRLFEEKERALVTLEAISDVVITTDINGLVEYATPVLEEYLGWKLDEIRGKQIPDFLKLVDEENGETIPNPVIHCLETGERVDCRQSALIMHKNNKTSYSVEVTVAPIKNHEYKVIGCVMAIHDISQLKGMARELTYQATHDSLTGLINRREFESRIEALLEESYRDGTVHALCYVDLDQFKVINDTCGHEAGDELLRRLAPLLQRSIRSTDTLARLGGDEFGILLTSCGLNKAEQIIGNLLGVIKGYRFPWQDKLFDIGASMGLVSVTDNSGTLADVLSAADAACYVAKEQGRNRIHVYESDKSAVEQHKGRMQWYNRINRALEEGSFELYFQPIQPASGNSGKHSVRGEFLLRMKSEQGNLTAPGVFIPAAERYHLMPGIDGWVVREVLSLLAGNISPGGKGEIYTINISAQSLGEDYFLAFLREQIVDSGVAADSLCFEITETAAISNLNHAIGFIQELKALGCRFALDDFGSGVSSLANLKRLPVDYVKIDGEFVRGMRDDPADRAMVASIVEISKVMGLTTIAEFVEDAELAELLAKMGVDFIQGYGVGRPLPVTEVFPAD
jgi:diguanylate cyclase (GGDEF)-like protein/PAS domain S-box-containing protein